MTDYGSDLHLIRLTPEFARLQAILGFRIKSTDQWAPYHRLLDLHGWKRLLKAAEQADPGDRWASTLEKLCRQYAKDEVEAAELSNRSPPPPRPINGAQAAATFAEIRARVMKADINQGDKP